MGPLRYTPAGLPALDLRLEHESQQIDASLERTVRLSLKALAIGLAAERLSTQMLGSQWNFSGFLSTPKNGKTITLHIQEFQQI
jgi:primosomal replication protein N